MTWACTSMPTTTSQSPVAPLINFDFRAGASISDVPDGDVLGYALPGPTASSVRSGGPIEFAGSVSYPAAGLGQCTDATAMVPRAINKVEEEPCVISFQSAPLPACSRQ